MHKFVSLCDCQGPGSAKELRRNALLVVVLFLIFRISGLPRSGKNIWKMKYFPGQGKVREFRGWPGKFRKDLERGNLKINGYSRQSSENLFILFTRDKDVHSHEIP